MALLQRRGKTDKRRNGHSTLGDLSRHLLHMFGICCGAGVYSKHKRRRKVCHSLLHRLQRGQTCSRVLQCMFPILRNTLWKVPTFVKRVAQKEARCAREDIFLPRKRMTLSEGQFLHVCTCPNLCVHEDDYATESERCRHVNCNVTYGCVGRISSIIYAVSREIRRCSA
jgi:hypothetical protein